MAETVATVEVKIADLDSFKGFLRGLGEIVHDPQLHYRDNGKCVACEVRIRFEDLFTECFGGDDGEPA